MPLAMKIASRFVTRWNEQGKRPRENTVQYEDVVHTFSTGENNNSMNKHMDNAGEAIIVPAPPRNSKLGLSDYAKIHAVSSSSSAPENVDTKSPEQEQREMVQSIAARVLMLQQPDEIDIPTSCAYDVQSIDERQLAFIGSRVPSISFVKYVERLAHNINRWAHEKPGLDSVGIQSAIFAIEYLERAEGAKITPKSIHRYFLGAFLAGIKFHFDYYLSGTYWAGVGGVRLEELNFLEIEFCSMLGWNLSVSPETYQIQFNKTLLF